MIKAVIFDCFGVLTSDGWKQIQQDVLTTNDQREQSRYLDNAVNTGRMSYDDFVKGVAELVAIPASQASVRLTQSVPNAALFEYIRDELKPKYSIGMLSNAADNWLDDLFAPWQIDLFDEVALSYQLGMVKPQPGMYEHIAAKLGMSPQECVFIDDVERYVTAATDLGMSGIVFSDTRQFVQEFERMVK